MMKTVDAGRSLGGRRPKPRCPHHARCPQNSIHVLQQKLLKTSQTVNIPTLDLMFTSASWLINLENIHHSQKYYLFTNHTKHIVIMLLSGSCENAVRGRYRTRWKCAADLPTNWRESAGQAWSSVGAQLFVGVMLQYGALPTNYTGPDPGHVI